MSRLFGTDGVRGTAGKPPLDAPTIARLGAALVRVLPHRGAGRILVGRDTRESGEWIEQILARGVTSEGAQLVSAGVVPTPGGRVSDARERHVRRRDRDFRVAQSVSGQRHQGVLGPRPEVRCRRRSADRGAGRRSVVHRRYRDARAGAAGESGRRLSRSRPRGAAGLVARRVLPARRPHRARLRERRHHDRRAAPVPRARLRRHRDRQRARRTQHQPELRIDASGSARRSRAERRLPPRHRVRRRRRSRDPRRSRREARRRRRGPPR